MTDARLVYVTGASSGIGQALARRYLMAGWRVALVARREQALARWVAQQEGHASRCRVYAADVRDVDAITAAGAACIAELGVPDVVVANAGLSVGMDTAERGDLDVMRATLETNLLGMAATFQPFVHGMRRRGSGALVGVASVAGIRGLPGHGAYCASKAGVIAYCESLRGECRPFGVKVVTITPGYVDTALTRNNPYGMPFLMQPDEFADRAYRAISRGASYRAIPWQMGLVAKLMRALPNPVFDRAFAGRPRKPRQPVAD
jgi:short-subunit dehydrogenase